MRLFRRSNGDPRVGQSCSRRFRWGYGACSRCKTPWSLVEGRVVNFHEGRGMFPLCRLCYDELDVESRLPYFRALWLRWEESGARSGYPNEAKWTDIEAAVRADRPEYEIRFGQ